MSHPNQSRRRSRSALSLSLARSFIGAPDDPVLTETWPWVIAFTFGLLHGLGFAGALREVGLPQNAIPLALLFFNVGVELGQLLFIGFVMAVIAMAVHAAKKLTRSNVAPQFAFKWCESHFGLRHRRRRVPFGSSNEPLLSSRELTTERQ